MRIECVLRAHIYALLGMLTPGYADTAVLEQQVSHCLLVNRQGSHIE